MPKYPWALRPATLGDLFAKMMDEAIQLLLIGAGITGAMMTALWALHLWVRNAAVVDVGWASGIGILAVVYAVIGNGDPRHRLIAGILGGVWSVRLALYIGHRVIGEPEDERYAELREKWATNLPVKFLLFFLGQGALDVVLAIPFLLVAINPHAGIGGLEFAGIVLWAISVAGESVSDGQLRRFKADVRNRGQVCQVGLWRYSRHPNYFFEWLVWCAFALFALGSPLGWLALICPAMMLYFLLRVTGIPATEEHALKSRGAAYAEYQRTTSAFVPWPQRASPR